MLVRLVLWVGAANGLLSAITSVTGFLPPWSIPPQTLDAAIMIGEVMAWLAVGISCLVILKTGLGSNVAISAQGAALLMDACYYIRQVFLYQNIGTIIWAAGAVLADWLLPILVVLVLLRQEMLSSVTRNPARGDGT